MSSIISATDPVVRLSAAAEGPDRGAVANDAAVEVVTVGSTGLPTLEPLITVTEGDETAFHVACSDTDVATLLARLNEGAGLRSGDPDAVVSHDPSTTRLPAVDLGGLAVGERRVLGGAGWRRPADPEDHERAGGFALPEPTEGLAVAAGLRGRGWGDICHDEPLRPTWERTMDADGHPAVVVNAHTSSIDTLLLDSVPFEVLDGAMAAARVVDADGILVYLSGADEDTAQTVRAAAGDYPAPSVPVDVVTGPATYRAGEPTMALEAIEGSHRLEARLRPPGPESVGLHGRPTLVHTARTFAQLGVRLRDGEAPDTRLVRVEGDVAAPATVELPDADPLASALDAVTVEGELKAACVGGRFGGLTRALDVEATPSALRAAGLGTEGTVQVLADDRCVLQFVGKRTQYAAAENCGRCVPCREGTTQLTDLLRDIYDGAYAPADIEELVRVMDRSSICAFGVEAGRPARTAVSQFDSELQAHAEGRCPADSCTVATEVT